VKSRCQPTTDDKQRRSASALLPVIKVKLEAVSRDISTVEHEFRADVGSSHTQRDLLRNRHTGARPHFASSPIPILHFVPFGAAPLTCVSSFS
jgi:hypothetical protein